MRVWGVENRNVPFVDSWIVIVILYQTLKGPRRAPGCSLRPMLGLGKNPSQKDRVPNTLPRQLGLLHQGREFARGVLFEDVWVAVFWGSIVHSEQRCEFPRDPRSFM